MLCSNRAEFSCDNLCGNPLPCGNHYCTYVCHPIKDHTSKNGDSCEVCNLPCEKVNTQSYSVLRCLKLMTTFLSQYISGLSYYFSWVPSQNEIVFVVNVQHPTTTLTNILCCS